MKLFDATLNLLERSLDVRLERHNVLASNLANADTPGFKPLDVDFGAAMQQAAADLAAADQANPAGPRSPTPTVTGRGPGAAAGLDGNTVDADRTLVALAENGLQYGADSRAAGKKLAILRYVASDGNA